MSVMATTLRRSPALQAGIIGAILGAAVTFGAVLAVASVAPRTEAPPEAVAARPAPQSIDMPRALREHLAREYGTTGSGTGVDVQEALRQHLAREYGVTGSGSDVEIQQALREHLTREYRSTSAPINVQDALRQHVLSENSGP